MSELPQHMNITSVRAHSGSCLIKRQHFRRNESGFGQALADTREHCAVKNFARHQYAILNTAFDSGSRFDA